MVAPVASVFGGENRAGVLVSAGGDDAEGSRGEQFFAKRAEVAADGVGAGLDPENGFGAGDEGEEGSEGVGGEFVEDVADDEEADGAGRAEGGERSAQSRSSNRDAEGREGGLGGADRVIAGEAGVVPNGERIEFLSTEKRNDAARGDPLPQPQSKTERVVVAGCQCRRRSSRRTWSHFQPMRSP